MNCIKRTFLFLVPFTLLFCGCETIDLYERTANIPGHKWKSSYKPSFTFQIKDTSSAYQLFLTLRHRDKYNFNNIYVNIQTRRPGEDTVQSARYDLKLGSDEKGWFASGMDDIYEHRIPLTPAGAAFYFREPGEYQFIIEQLMREDPLENVMNVGLRIEKKQP